MSYNQRTDVLNPTRLLSKDVKDNLLKRNHQTTLKEIRMNQIICIKYYEEKWYYQLSDFALWSKCGHIKTALFLRLKNKNKPALKRVVTFHGKDQFIVKHKNRIAIYNVLVFPAYRDEKLIGSISLQKIPNLGLCMCNAR